MSDHERDQQQPRRPSIREVAQAVLAGALGVQTNEARKRDFQSPTPVPYIIGGIVFTVLLIIVLVIVVNIILSNAGV